MKNLPILAKVLCIVLGFAAFVGGSTFFTTSKMRLIDDTYSNLTAHQGRASLAMQEGSRAMWSLRASLVDLLISTTDEGNTAADTMFATQHAAFIGFMDTGAALLPDYAAKITGLKIRGLQAIDQTCGDTHRLAETTDPDAVLKSQAVFIKDCSPAITASVLEIQTAVDDLIKETTLINDATSEVTTSTIQWTWGLILGGLVLVVAGAFAATRMWISKPLILLASSMSAIAAGDYRVRIDGDDRKDEIGAMARVAAVFKATGTEKIALEHRAVEQRESGEGLRLRDEQVQKRMAEQQAQVVRGLARGLEHLAKGDLVFRLDQAFAPEYERLRADFNGAIRKLQETLSVISGSTAAIRSGTAEISTAADDLSRRTEQQAASLEETAAALNEITATVRRTSDGATQARTVVSAARGDAERSGEVVTRAVKAMGAIDSSSQQIGKIISVIDEIAFQTSLLALNAGVEAARAGDAGRGFAVVASEVRALAQRSAEAAKEIKTLILASAGQVSEGVTLVGETGRSLERIVAQVGEIDLVVAEITASAQGQATALDEVNTAIILMDQVTQRNATMVEESTAASKNLAQETAELARLIGQFKVEGGASPERKASPASAKPASRLVRVLKAAGRGGAALKSAPQSDKSWDEF